MNQINNKNIKRRMLPNPLACKICIVPSPNGMQNLHCFSAIPSSTSYQCYFPVHVWFSKRREAHSLKQSDLLWNCSLQTWQTKCELSKFIDKFIGVNLENTYTDAGNAAAGHDSQVSPRQRDQYQLLHKMSDSELVDSSTIKYSKLGDKDCNRE